jgi:hypothetical protein
VVRLAAPDIDGAIHALSTFADPVLETREDIVSSAEHFVRYHK